MKIKGIEIRPFTWHQVDETGDTFYVTARVEVCHGVGWWPSDEEHSSATTLTIEQLEELHRHIGDVIGLLKVRRLLGE